MEKKDFRSLGRDTMETLRFQAVFLVLELHKTQAEAAEAVGVSRQTVNQWLRNHATEGEKAFLDRRRISARKGKGRLTEAEARRVQRWIKDKCPEQLKCPMPYGPPEWYGNSSTAAWANIWGCRRCNFTC